MKLGLLSFHNAANYGAALQAYALQKALEVKGFDSEYINYLNDHRKSAYCMTHHILSSLKKGDFKNAFKYVLGSPFMMLRKVRFNTFYKNNLKSTKRIYSSSEEAKELNGYYEKFIVGSDQVWNSKNNGGDDSFLLSFVDNNEKKISYSSSFGISEISDDYIEVYRKYLSQIKYLAVRERHGIELIQKLINRTPELVLDPVFLLSKEQWLEIADSKQNSKSFLFIYTNKKNQFEDFIRTTKYNIDNDYLYKISRNLTASDFFNKKTRVKYTISPTEFISSIRDAKLIVTASFHCVAMSIILNKPFVAILTGDKGKDERILNILSLLNLEIRIYNKEMTIEQVNKKINYEEVNKRIDNLKFSSLEYLLNALKR